MFNRKKKEEKEKLEEIARKLEILTQDSLYIRQSQKKLDEDLTKVRVDIYNYLTRS